MVLIINIIYKCTILNSLKCLISIVYAINIFHEYYFDIFIIVFSTFVIQKKSLKLV